MSRESTCFSRVVSGFKHHRNAELILAGAFQVAAEPLLSTSASAGDLLSLSLFPECLTNSAFLYALFYSILHIHNACKVTNESLYLKSRALECLRVDLYEDDPTVRALSIGTIVLLSCAAVSLLPWWQLKIRANVTIVSLL